MLPSTDIYYFFSISIVSSAHKLFFWHFGTASPDAFLSFIQSHNASAIAYRCQQTCYKYKLDETDADSLAINMTKLTLGQLTSGVTRSNLCTLVVKQKAEVN